MINQYCLGDLTGNIGLGLIKVPAFAEFMTYMELNSELEKRKKDVKLEVIGKSNNGNKILCAEIGSGKKNALVFGFPHPNEPIGSLTCLVLIDMIIASKSLQNMYTWYIVPCADPDGAQLNEGWFKGKFSIDRYVRNYYRSASKLQTDWSFPTRYRGYSFGKPPRNTKALARLIRRIKPSLIYPMHNAILGGAYFFMTRRMPAKFYNELFGYCKGLGIPLDMGEPEAPFIKEIRKPVYRAFSFADYYDHYEKHGIYPKKMLDMGTTSVDYSKRLTKHALGIIGEIPYVYDRRISDSSLTRYTKRDNIRERLEIDTEVLEIIGKVLSCKGINKRSPFYSALEWVESFLTGGMEVAKRMMAGRGGMERSTVAERFSSTTALCFHRGPLIGEAKRLLMESKGRAAKRMAPGIDSAIRRYVSMMNRSSRYKIFPINKLVKLQLGLLVLSLKYS